MSRRDPLRPLMDKIYDYAEGHSPFSPSMCTKVGPLPVCGLLMRPPDGLQPPAQSIHESC